MFFGAGDLEKVKFIIKYSITRAVIITVFGSVVIFLFSPVIISSFTPDPLIRSIAVTYLRIITFIYPLIAIGISCGRAMQGLGKGTPMLITTSIRILLVSAPLASLFVFIFEKSIEWVWYAIMISVLVSVTVSIVWLRSELRKATKKLSS